MARLLMVYSRFQEISPLTLKDLERIGKEITPDHIRKDAPPRVSHKGHLAIVVSGGRDAIQWDGMNVLLGRMFPDKSATWSQPKTTPPDGNFALIRSNPNVLEALSDFASTRTIWFAFSDQWLAVSTSQRALIQFTGSFQFNEQTIPWMLSCGLCGPSLSWDHRLGCLPPASILTLDKQTWKLTIESEPVQFLETDQPRETQKAELDELLREGLRFLQFPEPGRYRLALSGGIDSRGLLGYLRKPPSAIQKIHTLTWGPPDSERMEGSDAWVAHQLSIKAQTNHEFFPLDERPDNWNSLLWRFLECGEGRIDHISGYTDGFTMWKSFFENEIDLIIRGDQGFGGSHSIQENKARQDQGFLKISDFSYLEELTRRFGLPHQAIPFFLNRLPSETLATYRDRISHQFELPVVCAALTDLKVGYTGVINPWLSGAILKKVRTIPDYSRTNKTLFRELVNGFFPEIPYSKNIPSPQLKLLLLNPGQVGEMMEELAGLEGRNLFGSKLIDRLRIDFGFGPKGKDGLFRHWWHAIAARGPLPGPFPTLHATREIAPHPALLLLRFSIILKMKTLLKTEATGTRAGFENRITVPVSAHA